MVKRFLLLIGPVFSSTVFAVCLFIFLSIAGRSEDVMYFNFALFLLCALISAGVNFFLSGRERTLARVVTVNILLAAVTEALLFTAENNIAGFGMHLIAGLTFLVPAVHSAMLSRKAMRIHTMLTFTEVSVVGTSFFFLLGLSDYSIPTEAYALCVAALVLNLFMLSYSRIYGIAGKEDEESKSAANIQKGFLLTVLVIAIALCAGAFSALLLPAARGAILTALSAFGNGLLFIGKQIGRFVEFLISLIPLSETPAPAELPPPAAGGGGAEEAEALRGFSGLLGPVVVIGLVIAAVILVFLLRKYRKRALRPRSMSAAGYTVEIGGASFLDALLAAFRRLQKKLVFFAVFCFKRDTYEGMFLRVSRRAGRRGLRRGAPETPEEYLARLFARIPESEPDRAAAGRLFADISARIDRRFFAGGRLDFERMKKDDVRLLLRVAHCHSRDAS